jgi:GTP pyrophosphokinase
MSSVLTDRFADALRVAATLHEDRDGAPHTSHLLQVAGMVLEAGGDEDQAIAALFHDALETASSGDEAEARESQIRGDFGDRPADMVLAVTDGHADDSDEEGWKEGKEQYIHHLWTEADDEAVQVSAADRLATARAILRDYQKHGESAWSRYEGGRSGTLWYYRALVGAYRYRGLDGHVDELEHIVTTLEEETALA